MIATVKDDAPVTRTATVITLPWPPSVNDYWGRSRFGIYLKPRGREYRDIAMEWLHGAIPALITQPCRIDLAAYPPMFDARGGLMNAVRPEYDHETGECVRRGRNWRDMDNCFKAAFDALTHIRAVADDSLFDAGSFERRAINDPGMLIVTLTVL